MPRDPRKMSKQVETRGPNWGAERLRRAGMPVAARARGAVAVVGPTIGRAVHYQSFGTPKGEYTSQPRAATVTEVYQDGQTVGLCIMNPTGLFFTQHVPHAPGDKPTPGHWNWPPRV